MKVCLEPGFSEIFWCKEPVHVSMSLSKRWTTLNQTKALGTWFLLCQGEKKSDNGWRYMRSTLNMHSVTLLIYIKNTPTTTNYPCPLSRPTSAGLAWLILMCIWQANSASVNNFLNPCGAPSHVPSCPPTAPSSSSHWWSNTGALGLKSKYHSGPFWSDRKRPNV